jgi:hypothetical protein
MQLFRGDQLRLGFSPPLRRWNPGLETTSVSQSENIREIQAVVAYHAFTERATASTRRRLRRLLEALTITDKR